MDSPENKVQPEDNNKSIPDDLNEVLTTYGKELIEEMFKYVDKRYEALEQVFTAKFEEAQTTLQQAMSQTSNDAEEIPKGDGETNPQVLALQKRLEEMQRQNEESRNKYEQELAKQHNLKIGQRVNQLITEKSITDTSLIPQLQQTIMHGIKSGQYIETSQGFVNKEGGKTLTEEVNAFFETPLGKQSLPKEQKYGAGGKITDNNSSSPTDTSSMDTNEILMQVF